MLPEPPVVRWSGWHDNQLLLLAEAHPRGERDPERQRYMVLRESRLELLWCPDEAGALQLMASRPAGLGTDGLTLFRLAVTPASLASVRSVVDAGRVWLAARNTALGIAAPCEVCAEADFRHARTLLLERSDAPDGVSCDDLDTLTEGGALRWIEGGSDIAGRRAVGRWMRDGLFRREVLRDPHFPERLETGLRLRREEELPEAAVALDARRGWYRPVEVLQWRPLPVLAEVPPEHRKPRVGAQPEADWTGVAALEVELRRGPETEQLRLTEDTPTALVPAAPVHGRARAILDVRTSAQITQPEWTPWIDVRYGRRWDPQRLANRRKVRVGFAWVDPARYARASVRLSTSSGPIEAILDGAHPESEQWLGGHIETASVGFESIEGTHFERQLEVSADAVEIPVEPPLEEPAPVLIRLVDPLARHARVRVEVEELDGTGARTFTLSRAAPEVVWAPRGFSYRHRAELSFEDGRMQRLPWKTASACNLVLGDADIELREIEVAIEDPEVARAWLLFEAESELPGTSGATEVTVHAGAPVRLALPFPVDAPFIYRALGERYGSDGTGTRIPAQSSRARRWVL